MGPLPLSCGSSPSHPQPRCLPRPRYAPQRCGLRHRGGPLPASLCRCDTCPPARGASPAALPALAAKTARLGTAVPSSDREKATVCPLAPGTAGHLPVTFPNRWCVQGVRLRGALSGGLSVSHGSLLGCVLPSRPWSASSTSGYLFAHPFHPFLSSLREGATQLYF